MNKRSRDYYRKMRAKHIKRKKKIVSNWRWWGQVPYYKHDGMFSKGKIHCSCPLCKDKAYYGKHIMTLQEQRDNISAVEQEADLLDIMPQ